MSEVKQTRIMLKRLKVADFASEETLCFEATVMLDGLPIAEARNEGHGGVTILRAIKGAEAKLRAAETFAKALPPLITDDPDPTDPTRKFELPMSLDFLVDLLASHEHENKRVQSLFRRDFTRKVLFVTDNQLRYVKGVNRKTCTAAEIRRLHAQIRTRHGPETPILSELSEAEAFALWKGLVLDQEKGS
ncbi:MAG: hypothetical protein JSR66_09780 [Proteobacteria bacterium]|nr:hypothetical protein [Pseudomonadota bacterium]